MAIVTCADDAHQCTFTKVSHGGEAVGRGESRVMGVQGRPGEEGDGRWALQSTMLLGVWCEWKCRGGKRKRSPLSTALIDGE